MFVEWQSRAVIASAPLPAESRRGVQPRAGVLLRRAWPEFLRLLLVTAAGLFAVRPLLMNRWFGAADQRWFLSTFEDFIQQARAGVFPAVVGQTQFSYNGFPIVRTVEFYYLGALVDALTLHTVGGVSLLYMTVAIGMVAGGLVTYWTLASLYPARRWVALVAGVLYALSPAILQPIYVLDQIPTISAVPYVPVLVFGIVRFARQPGFTAYISIAGSLSLILASHPIVGIWCGLVGGLLVLLAFVFRHPTWRVLMALGGTALLFLLLSAWYLVPLFDLGLSSDGSIPSEPASRLLRQSAFDWMWPYLQQWFGPQLLPIVGQPGADSQQLGYGLWLFVAFGLAAAVRRRGDAELWLLILAVGLVLVYLWPIPYVTNAAYRILPVQFEATLWPHQRLLVPLAALASATGVAATTRWHIGTRWVAVLVAIVLIGTCVWSLSQALLFTDWAQRKMMPESATTEVEGLLARALSRYSVATNPEYTGPVGFSGSGSELEDPSLDNALIGKDELAAPRPERPIDFALFGSRPHVGWPLRQDEAGPSNLRDALRQAEDNTSLPMENLKSDGAAELNLQGAATTDVMPIVRFYLEPNQSYLFTYEASLDNAGGLVELQGGAAVWDTLLEPTVKPETLHGFAMLSIGDFPEREVSVLAQLRCSPAAMTGCSGELRNLHLQAYESSSLPIQVTSLFPYRANVTTPTATYLETHRMFMPGYAARVNGVATEVFESQRGRVEVPLRAGNSKVEVDYIPTVATRLGWWLSLIGWATVFAVSVRRSLISRL